MDINRENNLSEKEVPSRAGSFTDLMSKDDSSRNYTVIKNIVARCGTALELSLERDIKFYRGSRDHSDLQYIKPGLKQRKSRDNWNIWNVLFDYYPRNAKHEKRRYSLMFSTRYDLANQFAHNGSSVLYVLPVGNPNITFCPQDFIEELSTGSLEGMVYKLLTSLPVKDSLRSYLFGVFHHTKNLSEVGKALKIVNIVGNKNIELIEEFLKKTSYTSEMTSQGKDIIESLKNKDFPEFLFDRVYSTHIVTKNLSDVNSDWDDQGECWTSAPCYVVNRDIYFKCLRTYKDSKNDN